MENKQPEKSSAEAYREERKLRMAKAAKKKAKKSPQASKIGRIVGKVISIVLAVAIAITALGGILNFFGTPQMVLTSAKYGSQKATVAKYNYYYMDIYLYLSNTAQQYDSYYGTGAGKMYTGYDYTKTPMEQEYTAGNLDIEDTTTPTWADYIRITALDYLQSYTAYADLAKKSGMTLTDDEKSSIDEQIESVRKKATESDFSLNRYLTKLYGKGVNEKLLRKVLEERTLASNFAKQKQTEITDSITDEDIETEYNANLNSYAALSIAGFKVAAASTGLATDATDEEKAAATAQVMADAKAAADKYAANVKSADTLLAQAQSYSSSLQSSSVILKDTTYATISSSFGSAAADWALSADRTVGEVGVVEVDDGYVVMYITATAHKDESKPVNVRHILFQFNTTDSSGNTVTLTDAQKAEYYTKAKTIYDQYLADPTEDNFATLATNNSDDTGSNTNGGLYEEVKPGKMVTEFNDWCFDASRKPGDTGIIETQYGYHIMYYVGNDNEVVWKADVRSALSDTRFEEFDSSAIADGGDYSKKVNDTLVKWSAKQLEKLIKTQYVNSKLNSSSSSSSSSSGTGSSLY